LVVYHGDDFAMEGEPVSLDSVESLIAGTFKTKVLPRVGPGGAAEGFLLRRRLAWSQNGFFLMPDLTRFESLADALLLRGVKPSPTPLTKHAGRGQRDVLDSLDRCEATLCRRCVGILADVGPDRFDVQFTCRVLSADVSRHAKLSMARLHRAVRYMNGTLCVGMAFKHQDEPEEKKAAREAEALEERARQLQKAALVGSRALWKALEKEKDEDSADLDTKALEDGRIRTCESFASIGAAETLGFPRTAAMHVLAVLLLADGFGQARADDSCAICFAMGSSNGFYKGLAAGVLTAIFAALGMVYLAFKLRIVVVAHRRDDTRDVAVQGPVTYVRRRQDARFQPLAEHSWGAW